MSEAVRTKEEVLKDFRTQAILDAARRVVAEVGYVDASMERVAQEAGVAKGTLYLYFESKEALFERAIEDGLDQLMGSTRVALEAKGAPLDRLRAAVHTGVDHARQNRAFFQAVVAARPTRRRQRGGGLRGYVALLSELLEEGVQSGALRSIEPERTARMLVHGMSGLVAESLLDALPFPSDTEVDAMLDIFFHGIAR
jgi:AcrR family transcriptional regulator